MNIKSQTVSIITPSFNSAKYIEETIKSVIAQTYKDWEMIIVDDCSTDTTCSIIKEWCKKDKRIKLINLDINSGAAIARNVALHHSKGRFISYLDSDDIWYPTKLEKQIDFMLRNNYGFSCVSYEVIGDDGKTKNKHIYMKDKLDYIGFLTNNYLQTVGIMVDTLITGFEVLEMPKLRRRQDAATWLQILKTGNSCYGIPEVLAQYRRTKNSLSSNKVKAVKGVWHLYRKIERLNFIFSCYCFVKYATLAVWKRIYVLNEK